MIAMTTSSSMSVKPARRVMGVDSCVGWTRERGPGQQATATASGWNRIGYTRRGGGIGGVSGQDSEWKIGQGRPGRPGEGSTRSESVSGFGISGNVKMKAVGD